MDRDLLVTTDTEGSDGVTGLACNENWLTFLLSNLMMIDYLRHTVDGGLTGQLLKHLGGTSESVTRFTDGDVQNKLLNLELPHGVAGLFGGHCCGC